MQLLKRVVKPLSPRVSDESLEVDQKPLPRLPMHAVFKDSRLLHTSICIGFPKRPRQHTGSDHHPSLEAQSSLPDGLHKAKFNLNKDMLPSIDWQGVSVKVCHGFPIVAYLLIHLFLSIISTFRFWWGQIPFERVYQSVSHKSERPIRDGPPSSHKYRSCAYILRFNFVLTEVFLAY